MIEAEYEELLKKAHSFPDLLPPGTLIDTYKKGEEKYFLYEGTDEHGNKVIYYETERGFQFKKEMAKAQKKIEKKNRNIGKCYGSKRSDINSSTL